MDLAAIQLLSEQILNGNRVALGRAITLIESKLPEHRIWADELLNLLTPYSGNGRRIGITGVPGVGKSTFIEAIGVKLIEEKNTSLAVLAVDPSSSISGGSILGDKTRMLKLSHRMEAFIRPSPAGSHLGGVAERTREAVILCEAAGFKNIFIETVGVGQSETEVKYMVDMFLLLMLPGAGDELQGIKRGIMEMADLIVLNKCDGEFKEKALESARNYKQALHLFPQKSNEWNAEVLTCSSLTGDSLNEVILQMDNYFDHMNLESRLTDLRKEQNVWWFKESISQNWFIMLQQKRGFDSLFNKLTLEVKENKMSPFAAARILLKELINQD